MNALNVFVPLDSAAIALGADELAAALADKAQHKGIKLNLVRTGSRGMHWLEPLLEVDKNGERIGFGPVTQEDAAALLDVLADGASSANMHDKFLGPVEEIPFIKKQTRLIFSKCGVIDPICPKDYESRGGFAGLDKALNIAGATICDEVMQSGLRGRGGAGFPAGIKWNTVHNAEGEQKYIVINADEGDSGTFADRMIMEGDPFCLIEGMIIAGLAVGATRGYIYLRSEYPVAEKILNAALDAARTSGLLGDDIRGTGKVFNIDLFIGAGAYICGEETSLLNSLEGKRGEVRSKPPLPALEGLFGKPTLVHNVITICSVPAILDKGAKYYRDLGVGDSTGTMPFQLAGNVKCGGLFEAPFGMTLHELVKEIGGGTLTNRPIRAVQMGGPLGAYMPVKLFNLTVDYETMSTVGHGGLVVFDESIDLLEQAHYAFEFCAEESCGKCTPCRIGAVRGREVIERIRHDVDREQNLTVLEDLCELMIDGSLCAMGGMTPVPVQSAVKHFPEDFGIAPAKASSK